MIVVVLHIKIVLIIIIFIEPIVKKNYANDCLQQKMQL